MNIYFVSDLDGTLISAQDRKPFTTYVDFLPGPSGVCSRMTAENFCALGRLRNDLTFIPCTSRTYTEFRQLDKLKCKDFLCENGAFLYLNGERDKVWEEETYALFDPEGLYRLALGKLGHLHVTFKPTSEFLGCVIHGDAGTQKYISKELGDAVVVEMGRGEILIHPRGFSKAANLRRLRKRFPGFYITADDDFINDEFLAEADISYGLRGSSAKYIYKGNYERNKHGFGKYILSHIRGNLSNGGFQ